LNGLAERRIRTLDPARDDVALNVGRERIGSCSFPAPVKNSGKVRKTHSVGSVGDPNFGVFTITDVALKSADAGPANALYLRRAKHGLGRLVKASPGID
jgi:hypothetical protein